MNSIIVITDNGVVETPILISSNKRADIVYESIVRDYLGDDFDDVVGGFFDDSSYDRVNKYLEPIGISINYFTDIKFNQQ
jgi:hypothetical protein